MPAPSSILRAMREAALDALAVILPVECAGCGAPDRSVCERCRLTLARETPIATVLAPGLTVLSAARYDGAIRAIVLAVKEQGRTDAVGPLRSLLRPLLDDATQGRSATALSPGQAPARSRSLSHATAFPAELVCIPPSWRSARDRGYDPVRLLVRGWECASVLRTTGNSAETQKLLDLAARAQNRQGAFAADDSCAGRRFVIVDDILTSGATIVSAAAAIRAAGGTVVGAVTFAATPKRVPAKR